MTNVQAQAEVEQLPCGQHKCTDAAWRASTGGWWFSARDLAFSASWRKLRVQTTIETTSVLHHNISHSPPGKCTAAVVHRWKLIDLALKRLLPFQFASQSRLRPSKQTHTPPKHCHVYLHIVRRGKGVHEDQSRA